MNRSTIYEFIRDETELLIRKINISGGNYLIAIVPYEWEKAFIYINSMRVTEFQSIILFSNELVVRFAVKDDAQINIPYKDIESFEIRKNEDIGYMKLHDGERISY